MNESKTVEGEVADFSGHELKPDIQLAPAVHKVKAEQFLEGRLIDMYDAYQKVSIYTNARIKHEMQDAGQILTDSYSFLRFSELYTETISALGRLLEDLSIVTETYKDFNSLERISTDGLSMPKSMHNKTLEYINLAIAQINDVAIPDYEASQRRTREEEFVNQLVNDLSESTKIAHDILLTRTVQNNAQQLRKKYLPNSIVMSLLDEVMVNPDNYLQMVRDLAEFCKGKKQVSYIVKSENGKYIHDIVENETIEISGWMPYHSSHILGSGKNGMLNMLKMWNIGMFPPKKETKIKSPIIVDPNSTDVPDIQTYLDNLKDTRHKKEDTE